MYNRTQSYGGRLEGGYRFGTPYGGITPYAAIQAQIFHTPGFTETDAIANGFALAFGSRDATETRSELGARFDRVLAVYSNAVLALRGRLAWAWLDYARSWSRHLVPLSGNPQREKKAPADSGTGYNATKTGP
jgi:outer membrane autotransporter protein